MFSRMVVGDVSTSKKYRDGVAFLFERVHPILLAVLVCLIALEQADAQFAQQGSKLVGNDVVGNTVFQGVSVSLSSDGNTAIVGGFSEHAGEGAAWVYIRSGGVWTQQGTKLVGTGAVGVAQQGISVSLSSDGNTAIVGGRNDSNAVGAAWVFTRSGGIWTQQGTKLVGTGAVGSSEQGFSVSLSSDGNTAIVGGYTDSSFAGAAWVFTRSAGIWTQQGSKLVGADAVGNAQQGRSVSLSSDGNTAIVGGEGDNTFAGAVWVWTRSDGIWTQQGSKLVGSGAVDAARQGYGASISSDGNTAIVGGYFDNATAGAAWVWTRADGLWTQQGNKLVGTGAVGIISRQGFSVSLSSDGNTAIVGGYADNSNAGAAWIWTRSGGVWTQQGNKLFGTGAVGSAQQGYSVSLSADGNTAIVGGLIDNSNKGAAWIFATPQFPNPAPVVLGAAGNYRALAGTALSIASSCTVTGNVGGQTISNLGTVTGTSDLNNSAWSTATGDLTTAVAAVQALTADSTFNVVDLGGMVLGRGIYVGTGTLSITGTLTLNGTASDIFIIRTGSPGTSLITSASSIVALTGGAVAANVYWQTGSSAELAASSTFKGIILAGSTILQDASVSFDGKALGLTTVDLNGTSVLPVELVAFTATANRSPAGGGFNADLHWTVATEVNNYGFEIERRQTSIWEKVGFVTGAGTSNAHRDYSYTDQNLSPGRYAYRIKQINTDGSFKYTQTTEVEIGLAPKVFALNQNYPNPFNPTTEIQFTVPEDGRAVLKVFNMLGQDVVTLFEGDVKSGFFQRVVFDATRFASGVYFSRLEFGGKRLMMKMVLLK